ncbi:unnamed protein product, partial [Mesorhabditis belari]
DDQPFVSQPLEAKVYSVLVPVGCAPSLSVKSHNAPSGYIRQHEICQGTVAVATQGFHQFGDEMADNYELQQELHCGAWPVVFTLEFVEILSGRLVINFKSTDEGNLEHEKVIWSADGPKKPPNKTIYGANLANFMWTLAETPEPSLTQQEGCFARF